MAREKTTPSTSTFIQDYGLNVTPEPVNLNKRIVVIGTAEDGAMYEPVEISKPEDAELIWGSQSGGDLVRGIYEAWGVQQGQGTPNVVGFRIGNGKKAKLEIYESDGTGKDAPQGAQTVAIKLEAVQPGQIYNQVTVGYNENRELAIFNPKTGITTAITVDTVNPNNNTVDVHNVDELVNVINSDRNLSTVIRASYDALTSDFEVSVDENTAGVTNRVADNEVIIDLNSLLSTPESVVVEGDSAYLVDTAKGATQTASNNLTELIGIEAVSVSEWTKIDAKNGRASLPLSPLDSKRSTLRNTIQCLKDYDSDNDWSSVNDGIEDHVVSEYIESVNFQPVYAGGDHTYGLTIEGGVGSNTFEYATELCLDDSEEDEGLSVAKSIIEGNAAYTDIYGSDTDSWMDATCQGIEQKLVNGELTRPEGTIKVYVSDSPDPNGSWTELPYSSINGVYMDSFTNGKAVFKVASLETDETYPSVMRALVDEDGNILPNKYIRISAYTIKGFMSEASSLPEVTTRREVNSDGLPVGTVKYFVSGNTISFNDNFSNPIIINYGTRITYEIGSNVILEDANKGIIRFPTYGLLPGPGGNLLDGRKSNIRLRFNYMPNWPAITSKPKTLHGGTNGNELTNGQRYTEFDKAYERLRNYTADIFVPMGAFIDAITTKFNPITGLKEEIAVGFDKQLEDFLEDLSINSVQPHAVLGVSPLVNNTQEEKDRWVERLTVTDINDPNRGANVMAMLQNKFVSVVAFEPIFFNIGRGRPYSANGQAAYAGFLASIPYNISPMNKSIPGIRNVRFDFSVSQTEALNGMRYVTMQTRTNGAPVIVEDVTAAPYGSDFVNWSVFSITATASNRVKAIADQFIGRPNTIEVRASMDQLISNALMSMSGLKGFDFSINSTPNQQVLGIVEIDLELVPIFTMKNIRTTVKLRKNLQNR